jgi:hypothetical protein
METQVYKWTEKDKCFYSIALIPFLLGFVGSGYLIGTISIYLTITLGLLYILTNIFQAGACTGCPYRGKYCPPVFGVYLGNILSTVFYRNKEIDMKFIASQARIAEGFAYTTILFPLYWLFTLGWYFALIYVALIGIHLVIFMPTQCEKCSYNEVCPGGVGWNKCKEILGISRKHLK